MPVRPIPRMNLILCIGGLDPCGAAGILADTRMVESLGCRAGVLNLLDTWQGAQRFGGARATSLDVLQRQWEYLTADERPAAIKIGALGSLEQADWLAAAIRSLPCPLVIDPVLLASSGGDLGCPEAILRIAPLASLLTPNREEAGRLFGVDPEDPSWTERCPAPLLVTGADHAARRGETTLEHRLLQAGAEERFQTRLRPGRYRGSGCLLASAITCALARGELLATACAQGLASVDGWLDHAVPLADGVLLPRPGP